MIVRKSFFDQTVKTDMRTYDNIKKFQQVKKMITQLVVYWAILIAKNIMIAIDLSSRFK